MYNYSIMGLEQPENADEICADIIEQYENNVADCALFNMTLNPEGTPPIDKASQLCEKYDVFRDKLIEKGYGCGILVQASIGHGYKVSSPFPFQHYTKLTDGTETDTVCPYDENFRKFFRNQMKTLASHRPDIIMVDDDLRLMNRDGFGCACPLHMAEFNRRAGTNLNREELFEHIKNKTSESKRFIEIFVDTQRDSLIGAAKEYRAGIDEIDPSMQGAYCEVNGEFGYELAEIISGKGKPVILRVNNGNYHPYGARKLSTAFGRAAYQIATHSGKADVLLAETDTCPQLRYSTGAMSLHSHFTGTILEGVNGAKHWITRLHTMELNSGKAYRKTLAKYRGFYDELMKIAPHISPVGCRIPMPSVWKSPYEPGAPQFGWSENVLERLGLPMYFSKNPGGAVFLYGGEDAGFTDEEILNMLSGPLFLSANSAKRLIDRGFGEFIGVDIRQWEGDVISKEILCGDGSILSTQIRPMELIPTDDSVDVSSINMHKVDENTSTPLFPAVTTFKNKLGGTVTVFCGDPKTNFVYYEAFSFLCESRKKQFITLLTEAGQLPLYYPEDSEVYLRAGNLPDGALFIGFFNISLDPMDEIPLFVEKEIKSAERLMPDGSRKAVCFKKDGKNIILKTPAYTLDPVILFIK